MSDNVIWYITSTALDLFCAFLHKLCYLFAYFSLSLITTVYDNDDGPFNFPQFLFPLDLLFIHN